jgi:hypothetical protein
MITMTSWVKPTKDAAVAIRREAVFGSSLGTRSTIMRVLRVHTFFVLQTLCAKSLNYGRRDWTRTNDPYHVKVVL